jgi:outer membrane protein assembly factor BamE (lipoprotein component of BamABCDE complex)
MKFRTGVLFAAILATLVGCASLMPATVNVGETEPQVIAKLGQPTNRYQNGHERLLEYAQGPWGQKTYMARIGADGRLISYEQVLTTQKFSTIKIGEATKSDVLKTIGAPSDTSYLSLTDLEVWSYPYKESDVWNSLMHVHFDRNGVVRKMLNGPDPRFDPDLRFPLGRSRR